MASVRLPTCRKAFAYRPAARRAGRRTVSNWSCTTCSGRSIPAGMLRDPVFSRAVRRLARCGSAIGARNDTIGFRCRPGYIGRATTRSRQIPMTTGGKRHAATAIGCPLIRRKGIPGGSSIMRLQIGRHFNCSRYTGWAALKTGIAVEAESGQNIDKMEFGPKTAWDGNRRTRGTKITKTTHVSRTGLDSQPFSLRCVQHEMLSSSWCQPHLHPAPRTALPRSRARINCPGLSSRAAADLPVAFRHGTHGSCAARFRAALDIGGALQRRAKRVASASNVSADPTWNSSRRHAFGDRKQRRDQADPCDRRGRRIGVRESVRFRPGGSAGRSILRIEGFADIVRSVHGETSRRRRASSRRNERKRLISPSARLPPALSAADREFLLRRPARAGSAKAESASSWQPGRGVRARDGNRSPSRSAPTPRGRLRHHAAMAQNRARAITAAVKIQNHA